MSAKTAREKAEAEYDTFNKTQHIESDFDKEVAKLLADNDGASSDAACSKADYTA